MFSNLKFRMRATEYLVVFIRHTIKIILKFFHYEFINLLEWQLLYYTRNNLNLKHSKLTTFLSRLKCFDAHNIKNNIHCVNLMSNF